MKRSLKSILLAAAMLLAYGSRSHVQAIELETGFQPFAKPAQASVPLRSTDVSLSSSDVTFVQGEGSRAVGRDFFTSDDRTGGLVAGVEILMLKPFASGGLLDRGGATGLPENAAQMDYEPNMRYWLGWESVDGLGARVRYWDFDRGVTGALDPANGNIATAIGVEFRTIDLEMTQSIDFRRASLTFSGGIRYAEAAANVGPAFLVGPLVFADNVHSGFDGMGLTFATQATRDLTASGALRMTMGARFSSVFGNTKTSADIAGVNFDAADLRDNLVNILELNVGPQYRRRLASGAYLTLTSGVEAQYWHNALADNTGGGGTALVFDEGIDFGFAGLFTNVSITR